MPSLRDECSTVLFSPRDSDVALLFFADLLRGAQHSVFLTAAFGLSATIAEGTVESASPLGQSRPAAHGLMVLAGGVLSTPFLRRPWEAAGRPSAASTSAAGRLEAVRSTLVLLCARRARLVSTQAEGLLHAGPGELEACKGALPPLPAHGVPTYLLLDNEGRHQSPKYVRAARPAGQNKARQTSPPTA